MKWFYIIVISVMLVTSCIAGDSPQNNTAPKDNLPQDFKHFVKEGDDDFLLFRCLWLDIDNCIEESEFCALADVIITKDEPVSNWQPKKHLIPKERYSNEYVEAESLPHSYQGIEVYPRRIFKREGKLKIQSFIYGNPEISEIPFAYEYNDMDISCTDIDIIRNEESDMSPWSFRRSSNEYFGLAHFLYSEPTSIVLGKGKGKDVKILRAIGDSLGLISTEVIKVWKEVIKDTTRDLIVGSGNEVYTIVDGKKLNAVEWYELIKKRQKARILNSNNQELLLFLFNKRTTQTSAWGRTIGGVTRASIELIQTFAYEMVDTPEMRFLSYGLSLYSLYHFEDDKIYPFYVSRKLDENHRRVLIDIASQKFSQITNPKDGIKYLRLISLFTYDDSDRRWLGGPFSPFEEIRGKESKLFSRAPGLKDKLQPIALGLSERLKDDPDYPEWQKWVNKIFP